MSKQAVGPTFGPTFSHIVLKFSLFGKEFVNFPKMCNGNYSDCYSEIYFKKSNLSNTAENTKFQCYMFMEMFIVNH